jgi:hypothetical protein
MEDDGLLRQIHELRNMRKNSNAEVDPDEVNQRYAAFLIASTSLPLTTLTFECGRAL